MGDQMKINRRSVGMLRSAAVLVAAGALVAACSSSSSSSSSTTSGSASSGGATKTATSFAQSNTLSLAYTGGKAGAANSSLSPITIGYVNQQFGNPSYPEATAGAALAVKYVNAQLGGVQGHPIKLSTCFVATEEDGQKCGTQFLNDPSVNVILTGAMTVGNASLYSVVDGKKPIIVGNGLTAADFSAKGAVTYMPGAPGVVEGMARYITSGGLGSVKSVAVVATTDAAATDSAKLLFTPILTAAGIKVTQVFISPTAQGADVQSAIKAAGGSTADVFVPIVPVQGCISIYNALKSLNITPKVLTTGLCFGTPLVKALGGTFPNGWYFGAYGVNYFMPYTSKVPASEQLAAYEAVVKQYNPAMEYTGFAGPTYGNVLTIAKFYNQLGTSATSAQLASSISGFAGPQWGIPGTPVSCGKITALFPVICVGQMGIEQFKDGTWSAIADAYNNKMINAFAG